MENETDMAKEHVLIIIQSCDYIHKLKDELDNKKSIKTILEKRKLNQQIESVEKSIDKLMDDIWDVEYLKYVEKALLLNYPKLMPYMNKISIADHDISLEAKPISQFRTIYFEEHKRKRMYMVDITRDDEISIKIFDMIRGNTYNSISSGELTDTQKLMVSVCKDQLIRMLKKYLHQDLTPDLDDE